MLLKLKWQKKELGRKEQGAEWQWIARVPGMDEDDEPLMMLPTDMSLTQDDAFRPWVEKVSRRGAHQRRGQFADCLCSTPRTRSSSSRTSPPCSRSCK
jgi:hypothetical protein